MPSNHLIICCPLLLLPSIFPSIRVFSNELVLYIRWPKYWSFSFRISPSNQHPGLISFRIDWLDLLVAQGTLKSLLQHHSSKASILRRSAFFTLHLSHPYMTTGKTIALTRRTFVGKVMSLLFNMLSRLVLAFLPRSKRLLTSWLQDWTLVHIYSSTAGLYQQKQATKPHFLDSSHHPSSPPSWLALGCVSRAQQTSFPTVSRLWWLCPQFSYLPPYPCHFQNSGLLFSLFTWGKWSNCNTIRPSHVS